MRMVCCVVLSAIGCATDPGAGTFAPDEVVTGIYSVTATTEADTCNPARFAGTIAKVDVTHDASGLVLRDPRGANVNGYMLRAADGFSTRFSQESACPADSAVFSFALVDASASELEVAADETWTVAQPCDAVPAASCMAARTLRYKLVEACAPPCHIVVLVDPGSGVTCSCP